jgi:hypothetical protein
MPSLDNQRPTNRSLTWPGIIKTLLLQILVLLALSGALVVYLDWSSNATRADFTPAAKPSVTDPTRHPHSSISVQTAKGSNGPKACNRKA